MKKQYGGVGTILLVLILAASVIYLLVYFLHSKKPETKRVVDVDGVKVERGVTSTGRAKEIIQDTKDTLDRQQEEYKRRLEGRMPK